MINAIGMVEVAPLAARAAEFSAGCNKDNYRPLCKFRRQRREPVRLAECPTVFNGHVLALNEVVFGQPAPERGDQSDGVLGRSGAKISDHRHRRLLRARHERQQGRTAETGDEIPPSHVTVAQSFRST